MGLVDSGCRAYLALSGGVDVPEVMGSRSTYAGAAMGGDAIIDTVISSDLDRLAQAVPGNRVRFEAVTLDQAHGIFRERETLLGKIQQADLGIKPPAVMGIDFFNHPVFRQRLEKYMIQI